MTTPRIEEMQGRKIGEDKYTEHWSLDGSTYVQVPKWVIAQAHQAGIDEAVEVVEKARIKADMQSHTEYGEGVYEGLCHAKHLLEALQDNK